MNIQPVFTRYDINRKIPFDRSSPIVVDHVEDYETRFIEVFVYESIYNKQVDLKGTTITARIVAALSTEKILLNDNVVCTLNNSGNIIIPIDGAVIETLASALLIEIRITQGAQALVLPFPLYVQMRGSILDDAGIAPESRGTIPELLEAAIAALEEAKNYDNLENKPQINGHTLLGDKTSDVLGLQKKLTAGQNITIGSDGTISADGGVTSYNDLTDKPRIRSFRRGASSSSFNNLQGILGFEYLDFEHVGAEGDISIKLTDKIFRSYTNTFIGWGYDFNTFASAYAIAGVFWVRNERISNLPSAFTYFDTSNSTRSYIFHYLDPTNQTGVTVAIIRQVIYLDTNGDTRNFIQLANATKNSDGSYSVSNANGWLELGSGNSQIVSGVVNQNGTITFTDSDGNTFTTTGASVIGPQGAPGQDYVLTEQDKSDIADIVLGELPTTEGVLYGN